MTSEEKMKLWVDTWKVTGRELERIKQEELRAMDEAASAAVFQSLVREMPPEPWVNPQQRDSSGLVEQQYFFQKARRHADRH